jgi:hypothetical protein
MQIPFFPFYANFLKFTLAQKRGGGRIFLLKLEARSWKTKTILLNADLLLLARNSEQVLGRRIFSEFLSEKKVLGQFSGTPTMYINCRWICTHLVCIVTKLPLCGIRTYSSSAKGHHGIGLHMPRTRIWVWLLAMRYHVCRIFCLKYRRTFFKICHLKKWVQCKSAPSFLFRI